MLGEAVRRFAGQPFPAELQQVKDALFEGMINLEDDSARVSISPTGQLDIRSKTSNWNMGLDPMNKGIRIGYDSSQHSQCRRWAGSCLRSRWVPAQVESLRTK